MHLTHVLLSFYASPVTPMTPGWVSRGSRVSRDFSIAYYHARVEATFSSMTALLGASGAPGAPLFYYPYGNVLRTKECR